MNALYTLVVKGKMDSSHWLEKHEGRCHNRHGHRWEAEISIVGVQDMEKLLDPDHPTNMIIDFGDVKQVIDDLDHRIMNEAVDPGVDPTAEVLATLILQDVLELVEDESVSVMVTLWETEDNKVSVQATPRRLNHG
jgi:6-pyruvoyl tetrahydropterin synthase/QueD family protein